MKCEICGKEAPYFTETYDPMEGKTRTIYLCEEHQETMYMRIVDAMLHMGSTYLREDIKDRRKEFGYTLQHPGDDCCMNCEHLFCGPTGLHCDVVGVDVFKGDTCRKFKRGQGHMPGILKIPEISDADMEAIRKVIETNDKATPIIQVNPMNDKIRDIGKVLVWLYSTGIHLHGMNEHIEELLRNITKEGEE